MTKAQRELLSRCISADRFYRSAKAAGDPMADNDWRGVEIGSINGTNSRTAKVLVEAGLVELVNLHGQHAYAFLGRYKPYDEL
jgi:hypothetical protein